MTTYYKSLTYNIVWRATEICRRMELTTTDKDERLALRIAELSFTFMTIEAALNHLGLRLRPDIFGDDVRERNCFNGREEIGGQKYYGIMGKLKFIYDCCEITYDESSPDILFVRQLKNFRDLISHGKTEEKNIPYPSKKGETPDMVTPELWQIVSSNLVDECHTRVKGLIERLFSHAKKINPDVESLAFGGSFYQRTTIE